MSGFYSDLGNRIKEYRELKGLTLEELGKEIGVGKSTVRKYQAGEIKMDHDRMEDLARVFGIDVSLLYGEEVAGEMIDVPLYGNVSCGPGVLTEDDILEYVKSPKEWIKGSIYFYLTAQGDSMTGANIKESDLLLIRQQESVENGEIAAVLIDDQILLKRVFIDGDEITLISENNKYDPIRFDPSSDKNIKILGKLKKSITNF